MSDRVKAVRPAVIAGALVASYVVALFLVRHVPDRVVALLGGPEGLERIGGVRVRYRPPAGLDPAELARSTAGVPVRRDGDVLVLEYPGVDEAMAPELAGVLVGGLSMLEVLHTPYAQAVAAAAPGGATIEVDTWRPDEGGPTQMIHYLEAPSRAALEHTLDAAAAAGWRLPPGTAIGLERLDTYGRGGLVPRWRTYLLSTEVQIDGAMIEHAFGSYDPDTNRPLVLLDFTSDGTARFCELTRRITGRKLALYLGDRVRSAPVINGAICGGRASITMGGGPPEVQERERDMLVAVLSRRAPPPGGIVESARWQPPADVGRQEWLGRLLLGLAAGALAGGLTALVIRVARPRRRTSPGPEPTGGPFPYRRLAVTLLAPVALYLLGKLVLPGVNEVELAHVLSRGGGGIGLGFSVVALGATPIMTAFVLVELVALAVPSLRWRRHDPRGRVGLGQAVAAVAIATALVQGYFTASYLEALSRGGAEIVTSPGLGFRLLVMVSLAAGTMLLGVLAGLVREHGLGNGYGALLVGGALLDVAQPLLDGASRLEDYLNRGHALGLVALAAIAALTAAVLRWRIADDDERAPALRVPASGIAPLSDAGGLVLFLALLGAVGLGPVLIDPMQWAFELQRDAWLALAVVAVLAAAYAWLFARPSLVAHVAVHEGLPPPSWVAWRRAAIASAALLLAVHVIGRLASEAAAGAAALVAPILAMTGTAVVLDILDDARAHRRRLAPAGVLHQIQHAGIVERVLAGAGIPCHLHASHLRTLYAFFGPWAPVIVLVPEAQAAEARQRLAGLVAVASGQAAAAPAASAPATPAAPGAPAPAPAPPPALPATPITPDS